MTDRSDPQLDRWLAGLEARVSPSPELEDRVVAALRERRLLRTSPSSPATWRFALAASLVGALLVGALIGRWGASWSSAPAEPAPRPARYLLLLSEPRPLATDKSLPELVSEYAAWGRSLAAQGHLLAAERLTDRVERLGPPAPDGGASAAAPVTGFFLLTAGDWREATRLAATCPHLAYGGVVTVREVAGTG